MSQCEILNKIGSEQKYIYSWKLKNNIMNSRFVHEFYKTNKTNDLSRLHNNNEILL